MKITRSGVYDIPADVYHADLVCEGPTLSASIAKRLITQSPLHAWTHHPRLNPNSQPERAEAFDIGTAAHAMLLEGASNFAVVDAKDWRTKAAQEQRDAAYAAGQTPILQRQLRNVEAMVVAIRRQLEQHGEASRAFSDGEPEQTVVWQEGDVWCRARLDWLPNERHVGVSYGGSVLPSIFDLKTTEGSADPSFWVRRQLFALGYDIQAAFYLRGIAATCRNANLQFGFVVVETEPPYGLSVIGLPPAVIEHANRKVDHAIRLWRECLTRDHWPAYPPVIHWADLPGWAEAEWMERETVGQSVVDKLAKAGVGI